jgi:hypothetical protein
MTIINAVTLVLRNACITDVLIFAAGNNEISGTASAKLITLSIGEALSPE